MTWRAERGALHPPVVGKLFTLFLVVPLLELYLLLLLSDVTGLWGTILIVLVTGALGAALAQREGLKVMRQWQRALATGRMPTEGVISGALVLLGGVLLVTPGVVTDLVGLLLLLPFTRRYFLYVARAQLQRKLQQGSVRTFSYRWSDEAGDATFTGRGQPADRSASASPPGVDLRRYVQPHPVTRADAASDGTESPPEKPVQVRVIDTDGERTD